METEVIGVIGEIIGAAAVVSRAVYSAYLRAEMPESLIIAEDTVACHLFS
ncbi:MAG: hypothetical protein O6945_10115 [Gammaproteobacteria bacterium]|nr:hypothetical protein [Gammaproteobacteria bacterium]